VQTAYDFKAAITDMVKAKARNKAENIGWGLGGFAAGFAAGRLSK